MARRHRSDAAESFLDDLSDVLLDLRHLRETIELSGFSPELRRIHGRDETAERIEFSREVRAAEPDLLSDVIAAEKTFDRAYSRIKRGV